MSSRHPLVRTDSDLVSVGTLRGASTALIVTALIGGTALALELVWPWLAWGYVVLALAGGLFLAFVTSRAERELEREIERVRRRHRSG